VRIDNNAADPPHRMAKWCEKHRRWECNALTKERQPCHGTVAHGHAKCRMHAGISKDRYKAQTDVATAFNSIGLTNPVDPSQAIMGALNMAWMRMHMLAGMVADQMERDADYDNAVAATWTDGELVPAGTPSLSETGGLVGYTFGPAGITGEDVRALVKLESEERDRVARIAKMAHDMGIADREIRLAEDQAGLIVSVINGVLGRLGLSAAQSAMVPDAVTVALQQLELTDGMTA